MSAAALEHVNITVSNPSQTAELLCRFFDWRIRWQGASMMGGHTVHVGRDDAYLALYAYSEQPAEGSDSYTTRGSLNHVGVLVDDLEATEQRILAAGFETHNHADYEPGRRFYFNDHDGIEYEVVSYAEKRASFRDRHHRYRADRTGWCCGMRRYPCLRAAA